MADREKKLTQPANLDAERAVLGCIFYNNPDINIVSQELLPEDFYHPQHVEVYEAMLALSGAHEPIDYTTLKEELTKRKTLSEEEILNLLLSLGSPNYYSSRINSYIDIVKKNANLRALIAFGEDIRRRSFDGSEGPDAILESAESRLLEINEDRLYTGLTPLSGTMDATLAKVFDLSLHKGDLTGITTGYRDLDETLSGFQASDLILLAARPSMGKTSLGLNMAYHAARFQNKEGIHPYKVAVFSLEMSKLQLSQRLLSMATGINLKKIISGDLEADRDFDILTRGVDQLKDLSIYIDDTSSLSVQALRSKCRRLKMESGLDLVVIDYLQLMTVDDGRRNENRQQEITTISRGLKALAKEMDCPVLALSQLSRKTESREGSRPVMSDMRESGAIEQDADVVLLLYREDYYNPDTDHPNITELTIAKHRNGPTGKVNLYFKKEQTMFYSVDYKEGPDA